MTPKLAAAAFGDRPDWWPLPEPRTPQELWWRGLAAGGQGRYAVARADLAELIHDRSAGRWRSLGHSAYASFLRQLGWHWRAHDWDGRALARAGGDPEAQADALIGLAADALGVGRLAASDALLNRAVPVVRSAGVPRLDIRLAWVQAELAMAGGRGVDAVRHARHGVDLAERALPGLRRHRVKSDVVLAAALCCAGELTRSRAVADSALADAATFGLVPLGWALASLLSGIGSDVYSDGEIAEVRQRSAQFVTRHGGDWKMR